MGPSWTPRSGPGPAPWLPRRRRSPFKASQATKAKTFDPADVQTHINNTTETLGKPEVFSSADLVEQGNQLCQKGGTIVITAVAPVQQEDVALNLFNFAMSNKEIKGTIFGSLNPRADIPKLLGLYREGQLKLDELITREYSLDEINDGYQAMRDGVNIRGVIKY